MKRGSKLNIEEFDYHLPESLIAQTPLKNRDQSRLLVLQRETGEMAHLHFKDVIDYLNPGDTLVLNDTSCDAGTSLRFKRRDRRQS